MMKLTQRRIDDLACPTARRDALVFDDEQRGLECVSQPGEARAMWRSIHSRGRTQGSVRLVLGDLAGGCAGGS